MCRCVEGSGCSYHHDRYSDCSAVVHLRLCQGLLPPAPPTSSWDARVSEEEAWPHRVNCPLLSLLMPSQPPRTSTAHKAVFYNSVMSSAWAQSCYYSCIFKENKETQQLLWVKYSSVEMSIWFYHFLSLENVEILLKWNSSKDMSIAFLFFVVSMFNL